MNRIFFPQRFSSFLFLFFSLSLAFAAPLPIKESEIFQRTVIIVIDDVLLDVVPGEGPVWIAGNPSSNGQWVYVVADHEITDFVLRDSNGDVIADEEINHDEFKFSPVDFEDGIYYMQFTILGKTITKTLIVE